MTSYPMKVYTRAAAVTKSDTNDSGNIFHGLFIGLGGNLAIVPLEGASANVLFQGINSGTLLAVGCAKVLSTGTTCSGIVGLT